MHKGCLKHGTNHKAYKIWKQTLTAYKSNMSTNHTVNINHKQYKLKCKTFRLKYWFQHSIKAAISKVHTVKPTNYA